MTRLELMRSLRDTLATGAAAAAAAEAQARPSGGARTSLLSPSLGSKGEARELRRLAGTTLLETIVSGQAERLDAIGVTSTSGRDTAALWAPWDREGLPTRQRSLYRAALLHGHAYAHVDPDTSRVTLLSPRRAAVRTTDDGEVTQALVVMDDGTERLYDVDGVAWTTAPGDAERLVPADVAAHGAPPVVQLAPYRDLDGRTPGEASRLAVDLERASKTTHDRLRAQHFNSWRVRYATGLPEPNSPAEAAEQRQALSHQDLLTGGDGVSFGTLPETTLSGLIQAEQLDREYLAAAASRPLWSLAGAQLVNLSADALAEARSIERLHVEALRRSLGQSLCRLLRLVAWVEGREEDAGDFGLSVTWADTEARSLSQAADALGKIAAQLGVPQQALWPMIPGVTPMQVSQWEDMAAGQGETLDDVLLRHLAAPGDGSAA